MREYKYMEEMVIAMNMLFQKPTEIVVLIEFMKEPMKSIDS